MDPRILAFPAAVPPVLVAQGAEGRVFRSVFLTPDRPCALKFRTPKAYRHPVLDARLTRQRILAEARILHRCRREGVPVPALYAVDIDDDDTAARGGSLLTEWIDGGPVRARLNAWLDARPAADAAALAADPDLLALLQRIGTAVGQLHRAGIVHGDLTTSNLLLQTAGPAAVSSAPSAPSAPSTLDGPIVLIDFGLASQSTADEDRAVDLYVLERAFGSTHPRAEHLFDAALRAYQAAYPQAAPVLRKLADVRLRGRKRSMLG